MVHNTERDKGHISQSSINRSKIMESHSITEGNSGKTLICESQKNATEVSLKVSKCKARLTRGSGSEWT